MNFLFDNIKISFDIDSHGNSGEFVKRGASSGYVRGKLGGDSKILSIYFL